MEHLYDRLREYAKGEDYPYHMPGHKRRAFGAMPAGAYEMDVTEIDGFDDLHAPEGILKDLQERIARLYGADESFCLVNGSTSGILSALSAALPEGGHVLMPRNCHKSAYHAAYLRNLKVTYLLPQMVPGFGICDGLRPEQVQRALEQDPSIQAVLIVSPTYEGRISPVREIAGVVHSFQKILIVDEAHGAHLGLPGSSMENSCQAGADLVIHSVHKTLPAMTQTALLHVNGPRVDRERLKRFLRIYQSSSPSYVLMASIDNAITMMERDGERLQNQLCEFFLELQRSLSACKHLRFLNSFENAEGASFSEADQAREGVSTCRQDVGKLVICAGNSGLTGQQIYDLLREKYHLQLEMAAEEYCLAMFTVGDEPSGYQRMRDALLAIDAGVEEMAAHAKSACQIGMQDGTIALLPECRMSLRKAWDGEWEEVPIEECVGRIAAEFVNLYPPGTPMVVPGEVYDKRIREELLTALSMDLRVRGTSDVGGVKTVRCLKTIY